MLLFNGNVEKQILHFNPPIDVVDCLTLGDAYREAMSTYREGDPLGPPGFGIDYMRQGWYLNNGRGTLHGFICE